MYKQNSTAKPQALGEPPDYNEPDPNAPIYSMYGNNQFGSPVLPDQKPAFNSVYDIYGQGKMNDFSAGAGKTPTSPLDKPNANPLIGNVAKAPVDSNPYVPPDPSYGGGAGGGEESVVDDSGYTPGAAPATPHTQVGPKPVEPGAPPPLDKEPNNPPPPSPPGGGGGGGGSPPQKPELDKPKGGEGDGGPKGETEQERNDRLDREKEKNRQEWEKINNDKKQQLDILALIEKLFGEGMGATKAPPKQEATATHTTWDGKNWIIHYSDGSTKVSDPFGNTKGAPAGGAPAGGAPPPTNQWKGIGPGPGAGAGWSK
jgi:hypothetical protein